MPGDHDRVARHGPARRDELVGVAARARDRALVAAVGVREKRVNLLPAVARDCLQGACRMSEVSRARWARIDATTKNAPDLTACLMAGTRRDEATRECGGGHARRSYSRRPRWRAPMHG